MYQLLDLFFLLFHTLLIFFNLFGWMWERCRFWNLVTLSLTAFSWIVLGFWYGFGYCPCTDWHWQVRQKLGDTDLPYSYIQFLIQEWTGFDVAAQTVDLWTAILFAAAFMASAIVNFKNAEKY